jgi:hypothetical protein
MCAGMALEGALDPLQPSRVQADDVERGFQTSMLRVLGEPERRRAAQPPLLLSIDELDRVAEIDPRSHLDLAEDHARSATDDQVDLASSDAGIRREDPVSADSVVQARAALCFPARG